MVSFYPQTIKNKLNCFRSYQPSNNKCHILTENGKDIFSEPRGISRSINWSIHLSCADWITSTTIDGLPWNFVHTFIVPRGRSRLTLANPLTLPLAPTCVVLSEMCQQVLEDRHEIRYKHPCLLQGVSQQLWWCFNFQLSNIMVYD